MGSKERIARLINPERVALFYIVLCHVDVSVPEHGPDKRFISPGRKNAYGKENRKQEKCKEHDPVMLTDGQGKIILAEMKESVSFFLAVAVNA